MTLLLSYHSVSVAVGSAFEAKQIAAPFLTSKLMRRFRASRATVNSVSSGDRDPLARARGRTVDGLVRMRAHSCGSYNSKPGDIQPKATWRASQRIVRRWKPFPGCGYNQFSVPVIDFCPQQSLAQHMYNSGV